MIYYVGTQPYSSDLYHHGIKGQKWGVRRFQNSDGTLTAEGKARYGTVDNMKAQLDRDKAAEKLHSARSKAMLKTINPANLFDKKKREEAKKAREASKEEYKKYEKVAEKAKKTERSWMKEKYKDEIEKGAELYVNGYDPDQDDENLESLEKSIQESKYARMGSNSVDDMMQAMADQRLLDAEREANENRKNLYYLFVEWGLDD